MSKFLLACACAGSLGWACTALAKAAQEEQLIDFATQVQPIFARSCATNSCHAGANPQQGLSLEAGKSYDNIVNVPSTEALSAMRVTPFDAENSYLYRKLKGEQADLGGSGSRMPSGRPALVEDQIELIEAWINQGALKEPPPPVTAVEASAWGQVKSLVEERGKQAAD
ncbi:MAG: hypothetical protein HYW07_02670 [Candidatus Latescibacteria bacterium]|nr:hypothetical protein [Candidatus Latescibacterota bacterium]